MQYTIARCPFRINFAGGSTDYKSYYSKYGSLIVSATIQHYAYACVKPKSPFSEHNYYLQYSQIERVDNRDEIQHNGIRGTLEYLVKHANMYDMGWEIVHLSDLPSQTGIGSSSAFITALFVSMMQYNCNKEALSNVAAYIEREILKEPGGISDGISSTYGGLNTIDIAEDGTHIVRPLPVSNQFKNELQSRIFLVYTGGPKNSYEIAASHDTIESEKRKQYIHKLANDMKYAFYAESIEDIARLLEEGWKAKRFLSSSISDVSIDNLCESLHSWGAMGCRLIGSGGNGFVMTIVDNPNDFVAKLHANNIRYTGVSFDYDGAKLLKTGD